MFICSKCKEKIAMTSLRYQCSCGGLFTIEQDKDYKKPSGDWSMARYHESIHFPQEAHALSLGEGLTPITSLWPGGNILVKAEYQNPTLSFKDRGGLLVVAQALASGAKLLIQDSSGNAGHSVSVYAKRAGLPCKIFVPATTSPNKIKVMELHGAEVIKVDGNRERVARAAKMAAEEPGAYYASHVYNPFFYEGTKTYLFEIFDQLGHLPEVLVVPVGNGTLLLGLYLGLKTLLRSGLIKDYPRVIIVQGQGFASLTDEKTSHKAQLAEGIAIEKPMRLTALKKAVEDLKAKVVIASDQEIANWQQKLVDLGYFVEPTTAANFVALDGLTLGPKDRVLVPLCGSGFKSLKP